MYYTDTHKQDTVMPKQNKTLISIRLDPNVLERVDNLAKLSDLDRTKFITNLVEAGVGALEDCQKVGLLQFSFLIDDLEKYMKKWANKLRGKKIQI
jgi:hypothetical protein